ncbi:hypothetical protein GCM10009630_60640 [Kribbella jejuensis]|uniref:Tfp pilus assembly protein PilX n=1 Tax=Kribbella jejuensis TaxID=236068 RepID=A0A542EP90_9ACTN|nr:hypothetical protein [Kribbella jejuensis]TQJ17182.1 hypothetical protein FB475_1296 [Kribbella jejuensis]
MRKRIARAKGDEGAALVLVLIVITVIALSLSALLTLSDTSVRTTVGLRDQASNTYSADGAMQAAINNLRNSAYNDNAGQPCFGASNTLQLSNFYGSNSAAITCQADPKTVRIQCPSLSNCNRPGNAILTLGRTSEDGLNITQNTGSTFRVHGNVFSNSNINVVNGTLNTNAIASARTSCTGSIQSTPAPACNIGNASNPLGDDPNYVSDAVAAPVRRALPSCTTANSVVVFEPGAYDDAVGLTTMMHGNSQCKHSVWWFKPGTYYFDFRNGGTNPSPFLSSGNDIWRIDDGYLVAGTPVNAAGTPIAQPAVPPSIPGACDNPINNANAVGVQFIFGGDSQLIVGSAQAEICGSYHTNKAPVAVYGQTTGADSPVAWTGSNALTMSGVSDTGDFTNAGWISQTDGQSATWTKTGSNQQTGKVVVTGYQPTTPIPAGSILTSAKMVAVHGNTAGSTLDTLSVQVSPTGGTPYTVTLPSYGDTAVHTDSVDVFQGLTGQLAQLANAGTLSTTKLTYSATVKHAGIERVDSLKLELTFLPPTLRASSGCVATGPYMRSGGHSTTCALVTSELDPANKFYVQGTTYAPKAALDITLNNAQEQVFRFGVIARSLWVKETGSFNYGGVVIEVPDDSPGFVFSLYLSAYICAGAGPCSTGGTPVLRSKVALVDTNPMAPSPGHRQVTVLSWSRPG